MIWHRLAEGELHRCQSCSQRKTKEAKKKETMNTISVLL